MNTDLPPGGARVLCAVSGGADSMCLLHLLWRGGYDVTAAHLEHGIRGAEALRDARFVEDWCRERGIPAVVEHADVPAYAEEKRLGIEEAARKRRYEFLFRTADTIGADWVVTAHTMDDNAETLLFNLARGSGTAGLCGIPQKSGRLLRPLLQVSRREIEDYLRENHVPHVEDSTNQSDDYTRNRIRRRVVPLLRELNPRFAEAAARTARLCARDEDCLTALADDFLNRELREDSLGLDALRALHPAVASRVLRRLCPGLSMERVDAALDFIGGSEYALLKLPGRTLRREQGRLYLTAEGAVSLPERRLRPGERLEIPELGLTVLLEECAAGGEIHDLFKTSFLKYEIVSTDLLCTGRRPGDSLRPCGRGVRKKLSALFKEAGYTRRMREECLILRDREGPLLARGLAIDQRAVPRPGERAWKISFLETEIKNTGE